MIVVLSLKRGEQGEVPFDKESQILGGHLGVTMRCIETACEQRRWNGHCLLKTRCRSWGLCQPDWSKRGGELRPDFQIFSRQLLNTGTLEAFDARHLVQI